MLTNDELRLMADSQPLGPSWIRDVLLELLEHRIRIAALTEEGSERLSENELDLLRFTCDAALSNMPLTHGRLVKAIAEIRQRRASSLMPNEVERLRWLVGKLDEFIGDACILVPLHQTIEKIITAASNAVIDEAKADKDSAPIADLAHVVRNALTPAAYFLGALLAEGNTAQRIRLEAALEGVNRVLAYVDDLVKAATAKPHLVAHVE